MYQVNKWTIEHKLALEKEKQLYYDLCPCLQKSNLFWAQVHEEEVVPNSIVIMATPGPLGPNLQGMDSLTAAMKTNIIPDQEYLLQVEISVLS